MGIETKKIEVDDKQYHVTTYQIEKGWGILVDVLKIVGEPIGGIVAAGGFNAEASEGLIQTAISSLLKNLNRESLSLIKEIFSTTQILDNNTIRPIIFGNDFSGEYMHLFKTLFEILKFQFKDFLQGNVSAAAGLVHLAKPGRIKAK